MCVNLVDCVSLKYNTPQVYVSSYVWLDLIGEDHRLGSSRTPGDFLCGKHYASCTRRNGDCSMYDGFFCCIIIESNLEKTGISPYKYTEA